MRDSAEGRVNFGVFIEIKRPLSSGPHNKNPRPNISSVLGFPFPFFSSYPRRLSLIDSSHVFQRYIVHSVPSSPAYTHPLVKSSIAIREYDAKLLLAYWLERAPNVDSSAKITTNFTFPSPKVAQISWDPETNAITPDTQLPGWVFSSKLVAKPDQLIKRRGKAGLLALNQTWDEAKEWISARAGKPQKASDISCTLYVRGIP